MKRDPIGYARSLGVQVGSNCRFSLSVGTFGTEPYLIKIGDHVELTSNVRFLTHDGSVWVFREKYPEIDLIAPIVVGNNVFIGMGAMILPGITIGDNCIIGAYSLVTKDIPPNSVAAGVPARIIRSTNEYWDKVKQSVLYTHRMSAKEKREYLLQRFH